MKTSQESPAVLAHDNYSRKERDWRAPSVPDGDAILFDEPGRVLGRDNPQAPGGRDAVDCRSHYFRVTKGQFGGYRLHVRHGGGEESLELSYSSRIVDALAQMDSDARYWVLHSFLDAHHKTARTTSGKVSNEWRMAAAEKRIKTRKLPGKSEFKVWIEPKASLP
jgi:hypothetical protein